MDATDQSSSPSEPSAGSAQPPADAGPRRTVAVLVALGWIAVAYGFHYFNWVSALMGPSFLPRYWRLLFGH